MTDRSPLVRGSSLDGNYCDFERTSLNRNYFLPWMSAAGYAAWITGSLTAILGFMSRAQTQPEQSHYRKLLGCAWRTIEDRHWLDLPEELILSLLRGKRRLGRVSDKASLDVTISWVMWLPLAFGYTLWMASRFHHLSPGLSLTIAVLTPIVLFGTLMATGPVLDSRLPRRIVLLLVGVPFSFAAICALLMMFAWVWLLFALPLGSATFSMTLMLPIFCGYADALRGMLSISKRKSDTEIPSDSGASALFAFATVFGIWVTFLALSVGHMMEPQVSVTRTPQMIASNSIFDALTVLLTLGILKKSVEHRGVLAIPGFILLNVVAASLLAVSSLWFGLLMTRGMLSANSLLHIFVAHSLNGSHWEFGPYFWLMHTSFLPILLLFVLILACWIAKVFLLPVRWFLGRGQHPDINPLGLSAGLFGLLTVALTTLKQTLEHFAK
jgi:hypothetical protein